MVKILQFENVYRSLTISFGKYICRMNRCILSSIISVKNDSTEFINTNIIYNINTKLFNYFNTFAMSVTMCTHVYIIVTSMYIHPVEKSYHHSHHNCLKIDRTT